MHTASLTTEQFCYQVLTLLELAAAPLPLATIKTAFQAAAFANTFGAKFTNLQFTADANHVNYYYERAVKKAIAQGDIAALPTIFKNNLNSGRVGVLAENDELRSVKNWAIISVSVNLRAFFTVGMDYEMAYSLNDQYVRDIERLQSQHEVLAAIERIDVDMATRCKTLLSAKMTAPISKVFWRLMKDPTSPASFIIGPGLAPKPPNKISARLPIGISTTTCFSRVKIKLFIRNDLRKKRIYKIGRLIRK